MVFKLLSAGCSAKGRWVGAAQTAVSGTAVPPVIRRHSLLSVSMLQSCRITAKLLLFQTVGCLCYEQSLASSWTSLHQSPCQAGLSLCSSNKAPQLTGIEYKIPSKICCLKTNSITLLSCPRKVINSRSLIIMGATNSSLAELFRIQNLYSHIKSPYGQESFLKSFFLGNYLSIRAANGNIRGAFSLQRSHQGVHSHRDGEEGVRPRVSLWSCEGPRLPCCLLKVWGPSADIQNHVYVHSAA